MAQKEKNMDNITNPSNQTANTPEINQTPPSHPKPNPLIVISLIVLMILIAAGSFVLGKFYTENKTEEPIDETLPIAKKPISLPTTDPTTNWKTYINNQYNFDFKYPNNLILKERQVLSKNDSLVDITLSTADFAYQKNDPNPDVEEGYKFNVTLNNKPCEINSAEEIVKNITINNRFTAQIAGVKNDPLKREELALIDINSRCLAFGGIYKRDLKDMWYPIFDQILSTFKFIE